MASVLKIKNSIPGLSFIKYCPRSLLRKWTLTSFCMSFSPLKSIPTSFRMVLPAPSAPTRILHWIFFSICFPSLRKATVTSTHWPLASMDTHSCPIKISCPLRGLWLRPSKASDVWIWKLRSSSCLSSDAVNLYCEKCATEIGLTIFSKSGSKKQENQVMLNLSKATTSKFTYKNKHIPLFNLYISTRKTDCHAIIKHKKIALWVAILKYWRDQSHLEVAYGPLNQE